MKASYLPEIDPDYSYTRITVEWGCLASQPLVDTLASLIRSAAWH